MNPPHRVFSPRSMRVISLPLCYSLIVTTVFFPLTVMAEGSISEFPSPSSDFFQSAAVLGAAGRLLASLITFPQGSGLPSVPGSNLPDLDSARAIQSSDPLAPAAIPSTQACSDCTPCPTCGPGVQTMRRW
jgi:hypothetical protein